MRGFCIQATMRVVPLSDAAIGTLVGTPRHITSIYVFWHHDGERYSAFANSFALIARRAETRPPQPLEQRIRRNT